MSEIHRRTYLRGLAAAGVLAAGSTAGAGSVSATSTTEEEGDSDSLPRGRALVCEFDMNSQYDAEMHLGGDPEGTQCTDGSDADGDDSSDRSGVVHVTSNGTETSDYAHGMVNLRNRLSDPFTLEEATAGDRVSFDYYEGPQNARAAPDEVYVVVDVPPRTLDEHAHQLYGREFLALDPEQQLAVDELYRGQFDEEFRSLDEISQDAFGHDYGDLSDVTVDSGITAEVYVNQFGDERLSKDELADVRWGKSYDDLSSGHRGQIDSLYSAQTVEGSEDAEPTRQCFLAYVTVNDGVEPDSESVSCSEDNKEFRTFDVSDAMSSGDYEWTATRIAKSDFVTSEAVRDAAVRLRDDGASFGDFADRYGEDAHLVGVGFGHGFTTQQTVLDVYYDDLTVEYPVEDGETETKRFDFPAAVPADLEAPNRLNARRSGSFTVTAELQQDEEGLDFGDVIEDSVRLTPFEPVAPPADKGVVARRVSEDDGELTANFSASEVSDLLEEGESQFIVAGEFDDETGSSFFGVDTVDVFTPGGGGGGGGSNSQSEDETDDESSTEQNYVEWTLQLFGDLF